MQEWIADPPAWLQVHSLRSLPESEFDCLDSGEREATTLAQEIHADQLLLDETDARQEAARRKLPFIGTLGVLRGAARRDLVELMRSLLEEIPPEIRKRGRLGNERRSCQSLQCLRPMRVYPVARKPLVILGF